MKRSEFKQKVAKMKCPKCRTRRILIGPFYNVKQLRCCHCGYAFRVRIKRKEAA